jgi:hypothetical protein
MRGINDRNEALAPFNWELSQVETDLKQWMDNHRNNLPGENKIGTAKRDAINSLVGLATNYNRGKNPLNGAFGPGSAIKQFRLDRVDAAIGTGRQGFHFDYEKANGNLLPNIPAAMPDLSKDLPTAKGQGLPDAGDMPVKLGNQNFMLRPVGMVSMPGQAFPAYHGTPYKVDKFSLDKIGTGEGAQAYGWGLYFAESQGVAKSYRDALSGVKLLDAKGDVLVGLTSNPVTQKILKEAQSFWKNGETTLPSIISEITQKKRQAELWASSGSNVQSNTDFVSGSEEALRLLQGGSSAKIDGNLYTVDLDVKPEDLLDWDKPISEQSPKVRAAFADLSEKYGVPFNLSNGRSAYQSIENFIGGISAEGIRRNVSQEASEALLAAGIPGIRYLDGGSRGVIEVRYNYKDREYVVYNVTTGQTETFPAGDNKETAKAKAEARANEIRNGRTYNYVAFDENLIKITGENGQPVTPQGQAMPDAVPDKGVEMPKGSMTQLFTTAAKSLPKTIPQAKSVPSVRVMIREKVFDKKGQPVLDKKGNQKVKVTPKLRDNIEVKFKPGDFELPLPNFQIAKSKFSLGNKDLYGTAFKNKPQAISSISQIDQATSIIENDPLKFIDPKGYTEIMRDAGVTGNILVPPSGIAMMLNRPKDFIDLLNGGFHGPRTVSGTREAAMAGLDSVVEMRQVIGEKPTEFVTAMHHLWGTLSKQLPPLDQEALWMRLVVNPEVIQQIQNSIDGRFNLADTDWDRIVTNARDATQGRFEKLGNNATSNANSFHMMLEKHNGKWSQVADLYSAKNAIEMRSRFNALGHGATGIKNKVQGFIGLTFGIKGTVLDRWRFVDLYMDPVMQATGAPSHQHYFQYTGDAKRIPEDPIGIYGNYGTIENENPAFSLALYNSIDRAAQAAINASPELKAYLGNHADPGGLHWVTWNAIKNEAVGHSSLDLTKNFLKKFGRTGTASDWVSFANSSKAYVEGQAANGREIIRLTLNNGVFDYSRQ